MKLGKNVYKVLGQVDILDMFNCDMSTA